MSFLLSDIAVSGSLPAKHSGLRARLSDGTARRPVDKWILRSQSWKQPFSMWNPEPDNTTVAPVVAGPCAFRMTDGGILRHL